MMQEMWTILRILNWTKAYFEDKGIESPRLDAELLLCAVLGMRRIDLYTHFDQPLEKRNWRRIEATSCAGQSGNPWPISSARKGFSIIPLP